MAELDNWHISIEGQGPTHNQHPDDANRHVLELVKELERRGHRLYQVRFTTGRGEENWKDSQGTREMHEELYKDVKDDPHEELVAKGAAADATAKQGAGESDVRSEERPLDVGDTKVGRSRLHRRPLAGLGEKPSGEEGEGK